MLAVLHDVTYRRLFTAQVVALLGTGLLTVALGLLAYDLAGADAGAVLGTALAIKMVAYVGVAPLVSAVVHRLPRTAVLVGADAVRALVALSLPLVGEVWQVYVLVLVLQSASATFTPTFQSVVPVILPDERDYTRALSLSRLAYDLESLVSPVVAAALLTVVGYHTLFLGTVLGFVGSAGLVLAARVPPRPAPADADPASESLRSRATRGTRIFWSMESLRFLMLMNLVVASSTALVLVTSVVTVRDVLGRSSADLALALACYGAGSLLTTLSIPRVVDRLGDRTVMVRGGLVVACGLAGSVVLAEVAPSWDGAWWLVMVLWAVLGSGNALVATPSSRLVARAATDRTRDPLYAAQFALSHACFLLTYPVAGWVGAWSLPAASVVLAALAVTGLVLACRAWRGSVPGTVERGTRAVTRSRA